MSVPGHQFVSSMPGHAQPAIWALVPAAGVGQRALQKGGQDAAAIVPKQYREILGVSVLGHTLAALGAVRRIRHTIVVIAPGDRWFSAGPRLGGPRVSAHGAGGASRAESVRNGLQVLLEQHGAQPQDWVLVHDAARCLLLACWVDRLIDACAQDPVGGLLALPLADTLKEQVLDDEGRPRAGTTAPRAGKWLAQTPQMFRLGMLQMALESCDLFSVTDEASAIEATGHRPLLVAAPAQNFKVTYPEDFALAAAVLRARQDS